MFELLNMATGADVEAVEKTPWERRIPARSTYELIKAAAEDDPARTAFIFLLTGDPAEDPIEVSYGQFLGRVHQAANMFNDLGAGPTDAISFLLPLLPQAHYVLWGGQAAGIANPINFLLQPDQIADLLNAAETKILVALGPNPMIDIWEKAERVMDRVPSLKAVMQVFGPGDPAKGVLSFDQSIEQYPADGLSSGRRIEPSEVAAYFHTGGTTGSPKLALHTHANEVYAAWAVAQMWHYRPGEPGVSGLPLFHVAGALVTSLAALAQARALIIPTPAGLRNPAAVENHWKMVERYRPTLIGAVPTSIGALCNVPVGDADISSVQRCLTGGSALPVQVEKDFHRLFGLKVHQMYGSTESSVVATMNPVQGEPKIGSVGIRAPYQELRIVDPAGNGLAAGEVGEIVVRGPNVFPGYKDPAQNRGILTEDGWLHTGDLGYLDPDGFLFVTGRVKDVIIRSAHNIDPAVIEEALMEHPAVEMAAAVGRPDAYAGELPVAYVQLRPGRSADPDELMAFVETRISERPAKPKDIILIDQMPLTGVGKIFKPSLRYEQAERALAAALAPLTEKGAGVEVAVGENRPYGALATITLTAGDGADRPALERETAEIIGRFTMINHQIVWAE